MKVICISAKARHGKDTMAEFLAHYLREKSERVLIIHYADFLKNFLKQYLGWNGEKDEAGRKLLQNWGTDVVRKHYPNTWVNMMIELLKGIETEYDYVIIPDTRFPNEIKRMKKYFETISVRVQREGFESELTEEQKAHISETALDNWKFDVTVLNSGGLEMLKSMAEMFGEVLTQMPARKIKKMVCLPIKDMVNKEE